VFTEELKRIVRRCLQPAGSRRQRRPTPEATFGTACAAAHTGTRQPCFVPARHAAWVPGHMHAQRLRRWEAAGSRLLRSCTEQKPSGLAARQLAAASAPRMQPCVGAAETARVLQRRVAALSAARTPQAPCYGPQ